MRFHFSEDQIAFLSSGRSSDIRVEYRKQAEKYADSLRIQTGLRAVFPDLAPALLAACMEAFSLEDAAVRKCAFPPGNLCSRDALEMASTASAATLHASLLPSHGALLDIAAGVGADALALTASAAGVLCIEADPVHARMLAHNLARAGRRNALVLQGTAEHWLPLLRLERIAGIFVDPARRSGSKRHAGIEDARPPLNILANVERNTPMLVKISPAVDAPPDWHIATVAVGSECPEQLLSRNCGLPPVCAIDAESGSRWIPHSLPPRLVASPRYLIEPHAAIIRTGHVADYLREHQAEPIDPHIAYGWSECPPAASRWHQSFRLLRVETFNRKRLKRIAEEFDFGAATEIKKRGFPDTPEELHRQLKMKGKIKGVIILTRQGDGHLMIFAERIH
jgi:hypothetical protein